MPIENLSFDVNHKNHLKLDVKDKKILYYLVHNSRRSFTDIAKKTLLSKESVQYRYKKLIENGVILKTYPVVNFEALGFQKYHLLLLLEEGKDAERKKFMEALENHSNVMRVMEFSDNWDLEIVILAKSLRHFDEVERDLLLPFEGLIINKDTEALIDLLDDGCFPEVRRKHGPKEKIEHKKNVEISYDQKDLKILQQLAKDARQSTYKIAPSVGLSADAIGLRLKKLEKNHLIKRYATLVNFSDLDYQGYVFCFTTSSLSVQDEQKFFYKMSQTPHVISVKKMLGTWDMKVYVVVKNNQDLHLLIKDIKKQFSNLMRTYETWVIYKELYFNPFPSVLLEE
ncbi:Lrp/AsnC family transcriptional regulator [Candidatus Woesearchaeota archaeon]|jgi:DNA-binding Lrp family transcriptional regulator|nr:Lrp/AsnC family transcriptional regulator [Candidatus Woesearchaeota archaeon]MBT4150399.1 Lrp/AsnC family transcriptional regulator [Candidatus Woesearchaeota archaeon]MBT4247399.1 Lrp/AsnC family transcriptional regulator [Candidatus Woesearchaeota archaeon]MBT4434546.1 Lrp/AsnC family transcriptional regulator [Candidatus Woesearchaeota archaeon]MBT7332015.1 Lrp/AsnC family transcriptional regulator [Candidatus Woesearchaeota archaeon]